MSSTLIPGQRIMVSKTMSAKRGDIVVFHAPPGATNAYCGDRASGEGTERPCRYAVTGPSQEVYVKRIIAVGGDSLAIKNGTIWLNNKPIYESYIKPCATDMPLCDMPTSIKVPLHYVFLMGDNRPDSNDSRIWGPAHMSSIVGPVVGTYWPLSRLGAN
jgi:signal peptidase I